MSPVRYLHEVLEFERTTVQDSPEMEALIARVRRASWLQSLAETLRLALIQR